MARIVIILAFIGRILSARGLACRINTRRPPAVLTLVIRSSSYNMVRLFILAALAAVVVAAPADPTQAVIDPVQADTADAADAVDRERKSFGSGGSYTCNSGGSPHLHYGGGLPAPAWQQVPAHGHISYVPSVPIHVAPAYGYGYGGHYRADDGAQEALDMNAQAAASAQQLMEQRSAVYMGEQNQRAAEETGNTNIDQSFLQSQRAAEKFSFPAAQQMFYQQQQQRAVNQLNQQQAEFGKNEQMMAASSNQAIARSAYGGGGATPFYSSGAGSAVGVFPGVLNGGGCGNAIPLLLSCSPNLVQGHVIPQGHGGSHTSNFGFNGFHGGIGASAYPNYGATGYRAADGAAPQAPQQPHQNQQSQIMQQTQQQPQQAQQPQQNQQQHLQQQGLQQQKMQSNMNAQKESMEHASGAAHPGAAHPGAAHPGAAHPGSAPTSSHSN